MLCPIPISSPCSSAPEVSDSMDSSEGVAAEYPTTTTGRTQYSNANDVWCDAMPINSSPSVISTTPNSPMRNSPSLGINRRTRNPWLSVRMNPM